MKNRNFFENFMKWPVGRTASKFHLGSWVSTNQKTNRSTRIPSYTAAPIQKTKKKKIFPPPSPYNPNSPTSHDPHSQLTKKPRCSETHHFSHRNRRMPSYHTRHDTLRDDAHAHATGEKPKGPLSLHIIARLTCCSHCTLDYTGVTWPALDTTISTSPAQL